MSSFKKFKDYTKESISNNWKEAVKLACQEEQFFEADGPFSKIIDRAFADFKGIKPTKGEVINYIIECVNTSLGNSFGEEWNLVIKESKK